MKPTTRASQKQGAQQGAKNDDIKKQKKKKINKIQKNGSKFIVR